jgi:transcriptional regulator with XRE-family HTH domain
MEKKFTIEELVERIKYFCDKKEYDYITLSRRSGVPLTTLLNITKGNTKNPGIFTILKLCEGFGITIEEFMYTKIERDCNTCANNTAPDEIDNGCYMCSKGLENNYEPIQEENDEKC